MAASLRTAEERNETPRGRTNAARLRPRREEQWALIPVSEEGGIVSRQPGAAPSLEVYERFRARERAAYDEVFRYFSERLTYFAFLYLRDVDDAKDAVRDAFLALWEAEQPVPRRVHMRVALYAYTRRAALNRRKGERRRHQLLRRHRVELVPERAPSPDVHLDRDVILSRAWNAVKALPEHLRAPLMLRCRDDLSYADIAGALGITTVAARQAVSRACKRLREQLGADLRFAFD